MQQQLSACGGRVLRLWEPFVGAGLDDAVTVITDEVTCHALAWNHNGKVVAVAGSKGRVRTYDSSGLHLKSFPLDLRGKFMDRIDCLTFTRRSRYLIISGNIPEILMFGEIREFGSSLGSRSFGTPSFPPPPTPFADPLPAPCRPQDTSG